MPNLSRKGFIIFIVLGVIMVVAVLATVSLRIISNQARLTHHQVGRVQAQYAAKAGMVYALDQLRRGAWVYAPPANSCKNTGDCPIVDATFPKSVKSVNVIFCPQGSICPGSAKPCDPPAGIAFCINTAADYTYTP